MFYSEFSLFFWIQIFLCIYRVFDFYKFGVFVEVLELVQDVIGGVIDEGLGYYVVLLYQEVGVFQYQFSDGQMYCFYLNYVYLVKIWC